uniref:PA2c domain-containing protein n=1 Tax=Meloidogyne hapla TaxID=6305 RepID=A0A1I8BXH9_MELHA
MRNVKAFWKSFSEDGIRLEEVLEFELLEKDLLFWNDDYSVGNRVFTIKEQKRENCQEVSRCCQEHHECIKAIDKELDCPEVRFGMHYIEINTSMYLFDTELFKERQEIECLSQGACNQKLCECDSAVLKCWSGLKVLPAEKVCLSCYLDAARHFARVPIRSVIDRTNRFEDEEVRVNERIYNATEGKEVPDINQTLVRAVIVVSTGYDVINEIEKDMNQLIVKEKELLNEDMKNQNNEPAEYIFYI